MEAEQETMTDGQAQDFLLQLGMAFTIDCSSQNLKEEEQCSSLLPQWRHWGLAAWSQLRQEPPRRLGASQVRRPERQQFRALRTTPLSVGQLQPPPEGSR
jgi:hypothetical protein